MKLMRWFSFDEASEFWCPDFFTTKMVLEYCFSKDAAEDEGMEAGSAVSTKCKYKQELDMFRAESSCTPDFTARLLTWRNCINMHIFMVCCRATWTSHSDRARTKKTPDDNEQFFYQRRNKSG